MNQTCLALIILFLFFASHGLTQNPVFNHQDTLRGSVTPERQWWDLNYYHLQVEVFPEDSTLKGSVLIAYEVLESNSILQLDLQVPMTISRIEQQGADLHFERIGHVYLVHLDREPLVGAKEFLLVEYEGKPVVSKNPPWDGGLAWNIDSAGNTFMATACQGEGASMWWPCKDHMYDEPDSMKISITVPENLMGVGNGRLVGSDHDLEKKTRTFHWFVTNPINNYGVNINIGDYAHFSETYAGENGDLDCDYYVLKENLEKAKKHFTDVPRMLEAFEYWFGPYPFYEDGYKLVEVPYPGMEHQSSVTYGNLYKNGFMGRDVSGTGWGDKFDFIIIHESGHEWFANNITYNDIADMWVHEGFTAYSESLFTEYHYGKEAGYEYVRGTRANISNDRPIIGFYDVNHAGSGDMYAKGANMLHTIRQILDHDSSWRAMLRGLNEEFYHQTVDTRQIEDYMIEFTGLELGSVFDQYLRDYRLPVFEYSVHGDEIRYRYSNCIRDFHMPLLIKVNGEDVRIHPTSSWNRKKMEEEISRVDVHPDYYVALLKL